jgi:radical SAM protein with 4Fe4S-binding SPASM domain
MNAAENGRLPSSQSFDHLVYLRVFEGCNLHCEHCFIPHNPRKFAPERFADIPAMLTGRVPKGSTVLLQWHGGEPTLLGHRYVQEGIDALARDTTFQWRHGIQTNLMTYNDDWAALYHRHFAGEVGVSWDPLIRLDTSKKPESHAKVQRTFEANLAKLVADGLTPYVVVTATRTLFQHHTDPFSFFQFWHERGVQHVHLERVTPTGYARTNWERIGLNNQQYSHAMARWAKAYAAYKRTPHGRTFHLSPFENLGASVASLLAGEPQASGCWSGACDTRFHTIDGDGYKAGCTALTSEDGNTNRSIPVLPKPNASFEDRRALRTYNCAACRFRSVCKTGCLALDFDDGSGECSGGLEMFTAVEQLTRQGAFP